MRWYDLQDLLPPVYAGVRSMYETAVTENIELQELYAVRNAILDNFFVQTCDLKTIQYWEQLLDIELYGGETLDDRRRMIMLYLVSNWQITKPYVEKVGAEYFGENFALEYDEENHLIVTIHFYDSPFNPIRRFVKWFQKVCPAHIQWQATPTYISDCLVDCTNTSLSTDFATCVATSSMGQNATLYLGQSSTTADWINLE
jgi:hypothetical protein